MFGFFKSKKQKRAKDLLGTAYKVYNYRCDIIDQADAKKLSSMIEQLEELIGDGKIGTKEYEAHADELEKLLRKCGGTIYPLSTWADYTDMIVVAGILAIGIRSFFLQPFKIPTNSMYPSFYGMTSQVYNGAENINPPSAPERIWRYIAKDASNYSLTAPDSGELEVEINSPSEARRIGLFAFDMRPVKKFFVWPTQERFYKFFVGNKSVELALPADFPIDEVMSKAFDLQNAKVAEQNGKWVMKLGEVKRGEKFLNFDILGGDMLFVDRFTYNFKKPSIGDSIVFRTKYCEGMTQMNGGVPDDKYYIKRLVGQGGDTLKVEGNTLMRNGKAIEGSVAFQANAQQHGLYCGYKQDGDLRDGNSVKVEKDHYYAMGDNSANSLDSRYWGQVPKKALVGKSLIIFYPFTSRWGATK